MIIINLKGGLGNQMFQYATGRYISNETNTELYIDKHWFSEIKKPNGDTDREFELSHFNISSKVANYENRQKIRNPYGTLSELYRKFEKKFLRRHYLDYHPNIINQAIKKVKSKKDLYINGFFQSEENFLPIRDILLKEFTLKPQFESDLYKKIIQEISSQPNSASIHIRRGDYIKNLQANKYHGVCSSSYYEKAIRKIEESIENPLFYIFSDDPQWVVDNLKIPNSIIISGQNLSMQEELILMSKCRHNIIANSSFSWWGAWLNQNNDKIVIAPTPWVDKKPNPHKNIIPEGWITLPKN